MVAVPLFAQRKRERGFNQSVLLADEAVRWLRKRGPAWKLTLAHATLARQRSTESPSRSRRRAAAQSARRVRMSRRRRGREVLLVDDILTSGATARECARVLVRAGAAKVWVATLARAQKRFVRQAA